MLQIAGGRGFICHLPGAVRLVADAGAQVIVFDLRVKEESLAVQFDLDPAVCDGVPVLAVAAFADNGRGQIAKLSCQQAEHSGKVIAIALAG